MENIDLSADSSEALARDIGTIARIGGVPSMLQTICDETGMVLLPWRVLLTRAGLRALFRTTLGSVSNLADS
jgi:hypothetical protein